VVLMLSLFGFIWVYRYVKAIGYSGLCIITKRRVSSITALKYLSIESATTVCSEGSEIVCTHSILYSRRGPISRTMELCKYCYVHMLKITSCHWLLVTV
jgi:hypothetical protein